MGHTPGNSKNMIDIITRLSKYAPPDRTVDSQRQIAVDIDLLEACKESLEYLRECGIDELTAPESELMCKLESAIQKAEGGKV